jgi:hypothetical protein
MTAPLSAAYRFAPDPIWKNEKNPAIEIKFPLHLSLSIASMLEDKRSDASLSRLPRCSRTSAALAGRKMCYPKTTGKRVIKRHAEKLLIYAAFER